MSKRIWTDSEVISFVNWYVRLKKLDVRYELENMSILDSFRDGDPIDAWDSKVKEDLIVLKTCPPNATP